MNQKHRTLLKRWEGLCVLCGELISNPDSVTKEHLIPGSKGGTNGADNLAPSHFQCNQIRGDLSLRETAVLMALRKKQMGEERFLEYINKSVPNRYPYEEPGNPLYGKKPMKKGKRRVELEENSRTSKS
jgi:hypothetical protein